MKMKASDTKNSQHGKVILFTAFGAALGAVVGTLTDNVGLWVGLGTSLGCALGFVFNKESKPSAGK